MKIVMFVVVILIVLILAHNVVAKALVEKGVHRVTGMPLSIGKLDINFQNNFVDIESLVIKNPEGFQDTNLLEVPKIYVRYSLSDMLKRKMHFENIEFNMKQFTVVKNKAGELNLDRLKALQGTQQKPAPEVAKKPKAPSKPVPIQIDIMRLKLGRVVYTDLAAGSPDKTVLINLDQTFQNITDLNSVIRLIVLQAMMSSGIANIVNFDIRGLEGTLMGAFDTTTKFAAEKAAQSLDMLKTAAGDAAIPGQAGELFKSTTGAVGSTAKDVTGLAGNTVQGVTSGVKSVTSSLKNTLKNPFEKSST